MEIEQLIFGLIFFYVKLHLCIFGGFLRKFNLNFSFRFYV